MADGAKEITKAIHEVFGNTTKRIMCWSHKYRAYKDNSSMRKLSRLNKKVANELDEDLKQIQWMISNDDEFIHVYDLLEKKYIEGEYTDEKKNTLTSFWTYHRNQWGPTSRVRYWYEAANPFHISNNQGIESKNREIKDNHTLREQLSVGEFFEQAEKIMSYN